MICQLLSRSKTNGCVGIVDLCIVFNNDLGSIIVLKEFRLGGCWICKDCSGSTSGDLPTGQELGKDYIEEECGVYSCLMLKLG